jgi:ribosomal protein S18 acetylase RimI-like enzyme
MNSDIEILKEYNKNTIEKLVKIHLAAFEKFNFRPWNYLDFIDLLNNGSKLFYYRSENKIFGFVIVNFSSEFSEIITIAVDSIYQGNGIGRKLLKYIINYPKFYGELHLEVAKNNYNAIAFYKEFDFNIISERKNYYLIYKGKNKGNKVDALVMKFSK